MKKRTCLKCDKEIKCGWFCKKCEIANKRATGYYGRSSKKTQTGHHWGGE